MSYTLARVFLNVQTVWKNNGLSIVLFVLFMASLVGHSIAGWKTHNDEQREHSEDQLTYVEYIRSSDFGETVFENWESEFFQMMFYVFLTVFLYQKGSAESKDPDDDDPTEAEPMLHMHDPNAPWPVRKGGWILALYKNSLALALGLLFLISFLGHAATGARKYNLEQFAHGESETVGMISYMTKPQFWFESFQNWQSEFLAVLAIVVLSIWLRQWGSPESKPVHAPHHGETGH